MTAKSSAVHRCPAADRQPPAQREASRAPRFRMILTHLPGPIGIPLPNVDWRIVQAATAFEALRAKTSIFTGRTGGSGMLTLSAGQAKLLTKLYEDHPWPTWVLFSSQARQLQITCEKPDWSDEQRRDHALDAMAFSDTLERVGDDSIVGSGQRHQAFAESETTQDDALFAKFRGR